MASKIFGHRLWKRARSPKTLSHSFIKTTLRMDADVQGNVHPHEESVPASADEDVYRYTSGRWLWNEDEQFKCRYVKFNIPALCAVAARSIGSRHCVEVLKLTEGNFNKALLLVMDDGREVIAKIPNPNAGRPHYTTASEVATMDFVRNQLQIPAPKVYAWNSRATTSPVGAEYIIMEKVPGVQLATAWDGMHGRDRAQIIEQLVQYDSALASTPFSACGGLYYSSDIAVTESVQASTTNSSSHGRFAVGPTNHRSYFDDGRGALLLDRGPWTSVHDFVLANARREQQSIRSIEKKPLTQGLFNAPGQYRPSKTAKLQVLESFMHISRFLLPKEEETLVPVLWHSDLHTSNIFVDPDRPTKITGIIDWQAVSIAPLFLQVRTPYLLEFDGPMPPAGLDQIHLPANFDSLSPDEQHAAKVLQRDQIMHKLYEIGLLQHAKPAARALRSRDIIGSQVIGMAANLFKDGEPVVLGYLMRIADEWNSIVGLDPQTGAPRVPCPLDFTPEDRQQQKRDEDLWSTGVELLADIRDQLGVYNGWDGHVSHEDFQEMKKKVHAVRELILHKVTRTEEELKAWEEAWPFPCES